MPPVAALIFALGLTAHVTGDFVLQTEAIARGKRQSHRMLAWHLTQHLLVTAAALTAGHILLSRTGAGASWELDESGWVLLTVVGTHGIIDRLKIAADRRWGIRPEFFVVDQSAHLAVLTTVVLWLSGQHDEWATLTLEPLHVMDRSMSWARVIGAVAASVYAMRGGAILCWLVHAPTLRAMNPQERARARLPEYPLREPADLLRGYAERLVGMGVVLAGWLPVLAILYGVLALRWARSAREEGWRSPDTRYRGINLAIGAATVLVLGSAIRWVTPA